MGGGQIGEADDGVHGGADIVGHIVEEHGLGLRGPLGLDQRLLQKRTLFPELFIGLLAFGDVYEHSHIGDGGAVLPAGELARGLEPAVAPVFGQETVFHVINLFAGVVLDGGIIFPQHPVMVFGVEEV